MSSLQPPAKTHAVDLRTFPRYTLCGQPASFLTTLQARPAWSIHVSPNPCRQCLHIAQNRNGIQRRRPPPRLKPYRQSRRPRTTPPARTGPGTRPTH